MTTTLLFIISRRYRVSVSIMPTHVDDDTRLIVCLLVLNLFEFSLEC